MSSDSVVGNVVHSATHLSDWHSVSSNPLFSGLFPGAPDEAVAGAQPDPSQSTMTALQQQLKNEVSMRQNQTLLTGGQGVGGVATASRLFGM